MYTYVRVHVCRWLSPRVCACTYRVQGVGVDVPLSISGVAGEEGSGVGVVDDAIEGRELEPFREAVLRCCVGCMEKDIRDSCKYAGAALSVDVDDGRKCTPTRHKTHAYLSSKTMRPRTWIWLPVAAAPPKMGMVVLGQTPQRVCSPRYKASAPEWTCVLVIVMRGWSFVNAQSSEKKKRTWIHALFAHAWIGKRANRLTHPCARGGAFRCGTCWASVSYE